MKALFRLPTAAAVYDNPSAEELQELTAKMPNARWTKYGNLNLETRVVSRSTASTFVISDEDDPGIPRTISSDDAAEWIDKQDAYIADREMIVIDGYLGAQPDLRTPVRLFMEAANANIAGMQQQLLFPVEDPETFEPELVVIYTPNLEAPGMPDDRLIIVDLEQGVTRVFNSDYFGESKKGFLRMWNKLVYERGGLPLHAGCKIIPTERGDRVGLIVGLSGTGKTTTTFTRQNGSLPVQDDFVAWLADGRVSVTEHGCFAKTFNINPRRRAGHLRRGHAASLVPRERVADRRRGRLLRHLVHEERPRDLPVRGDRVGCDAADRRRALPPDPEPQREHHPRSREARRAASSGLFHARGDDRDERRRQGRGGQVPPRAGHEPVLPDAARPPGEPLPRARSRASARGLPHEHRLGRRQGRRRAGEEGAHPALVRDRQGHRRGHDHVGDGSGLRLPGRARRFPGMEPEDMDVLQPHRLYEAQGRLDEYEAMVKRFKAERVEFLSDFPSLSEEIVAAVG